MSKPELVLSNTTTFFSGRLEKLFQKAQKYGFKYLEIVPYRWTKPEEVLQLEKRYNVQVVGIHFPQWWNLSFWQALRESSNLLEKIFVLVWDYYLGKGAKNPGLAIAEVLNPRPYLLFHTNLIDELGEKFNVLAQEKAIVIENLVYHPRDPGYFWDPLEIRKIIQKRGLKAGFVFDPGHFKATMKKLPRLNLIETYRQTAPEIIHISYNHIIPHVLPDKAEQEELKQMLRLHQPKYIVLETNPLVSVKKGKEILEKIIS